MPQLKRYLGRSSNSSCVCLAKGISALMCMAIVLLTMLGGGLLVGCKNGATIWSSQVPSPDGQWTSKAQTDQYSGPGNAGLVTTVYLKRVKGPQKPVVILAVEQNSKSIGLKMNWVTPANLKITYNQPVSVDFEAIKCGGINISVRDLSNSTTSSGQ